MFLAGMTILVVEDEHLIRMGATAALIARGFVVLEAANADEAITLLDVGTDVSTVFTDIQMPGSMDGVKLAESVRKQWPEMTIVITSGNLRSGEIELPAGAHFLAKPCTIDDLVTIAGADRSPDLIYTQPFPA